MEKSSIDRIVNLREGGNELFAHLGEVFDERKEFTTSGTTGVPKRVSHRNIDLVENAKAFNMASGVDADTVMYHCLPLRYMAGYLNTIVSPLAAGGRVVIGPQFNPLNFWDMPLRLGCNALWLSPTMAEMLIRASRSNETSAAVRESFRHIFCGMAPLRPETRKRWFEMFGVPLRNSFGTSEHLLVSVQSEWTAAACEDHCGGLLWGVTAKTMDGALLVASRYSTEGQYTPTGDFGEIKDGSLHVSGRVDDLIIRGGENIDPRMIEDVIRSVVGIRDVAVVGRPHDVWGQTVVAFVEGDGYVEIPDLWNLLESKLSKAYCPTEIIYVREMPRTETGKIKREELRSRIYNAKM